MSISTTIHLLSSTTKEEQYLVELEDSNGSSVLGAFCSWQEANDHLKSIKEEYSNSKLNLLRKTIVTTIEDIT
jgi:hypothetical protein